MIRVVVANRPRLMRDMVLATISGQPDIEISGQAENDAEIVGILEEKHFDVLIIATDDRGQRPALCDLLLRQHPDLKILALSPGCDQGALYWASLEIHSHPVEASEESVLRALRSKSHQMVGGEQ